MSHVPGGRILLDTELLHPEAQRLKEFLEKRIAGQPMAIDRIAKKHNNSYSPIHDTGRPISVHFWLGPTGVGKTDTAKAIGEFLFGKGGGVTRIDLEGLGEKHALQSALIGAPPGYIGFWNPNDPRNEGMPPPLAQVTIDMPAQRQFEAGLLRTDREAARLFLKIQDFKGEPKTDPQKWKEKLALAQREFADYVKRRVGEARHLFTSVILFDEVEKAHIEFQNMMLKVIDEGHLMLPNGMKTDFRNSHIIMTSNLASEKIDALLRGKTGLGFTSSLRQADGEKDSRGRQKDPLYETVKDDLKKFCTPAFLGRIRDHIVVFRPLGRADLREILKRKIAILQADVSERFPIALTITDRAKEYIFEQASDHPEDGARLIKEKLDHYVREPLGRLIISGQVSAMDEIKVRLHGGKIEFLKCNPASGGERRVPVFIES